MNGILKFCLIFGWVLTAWEARGAVFVADANDTRLIGEYLQFLEDPSGELDYSDVLNRKGDFSQNLGQVFTHIATPSRFWFYFSVKNETGQELWMDVNNSNLTDVQFYKFDQDYNLLDSSHTGALMPNQTKATNVYTFQFPLADKSEKEELHFLLGIKTHLAFEVPVYVGPFGQISDNRNTFDYLSIFFIGAVVIMLLYNVFIYVVTSEKIYLYYLAYLSSIVIVGSYLNNFPFIEFFFGKNLAYNYLDLWLWIVFITTGSFTIAFFNFRKTAPLFYKILMAEMSVFLIFGLLNVFLPLSTIANYYQIAAVLFYCTCLVMGFIMLYIGYSRAKLYTVGWTGMMLGAILYILVFNGFLPYNAFFRNISYFGALLEILVFSIALGQRINQLRLKEKNLNKSLVNKNKELVGLNESLDSFNYHVSHDLKTVLNNTRALTAMAEKYNRKGDEKKVEEILQKLQNVNDNAVETVQSFLSLGKVDTLFKEANKKPVHLEKAIYRIVDQHNLQKEIDVSVDLDEIGAMPIHEKALESIFLNFFTNTIKYNRKHPKANISLLDRKEQFILRYTDNGIGINLEEYGDRLFKPFQRAHEDFGKEGSGVGLYLVRKIVENYSGTIEVQSKPEYGVTFTIKLPKSVNEE